MFAIWWCILRVPAMENAFNRWRGRSRRRRGSHCGGNLRFRLECGYFALRFFMYTYNFSFKFDEYVKSNRIFMSWERCRRIGKIWGSLEIKVETCSGLCNRQAIGASSTHFCEDSGGDVLRCWRWIQDTWWHFAPLKSKTQVHEVGYPTSRNVQCTSGVEKHLFVPVYGLL